MTVQKLGLSENLINTFPDYLEEQQSLARVIQEHKELYIVQNDHAAFKAEITGNLRYTAESREDFPAVGDWVSINVVDRNSAIIYKVLPRFSQLERHAVGAYAEKQLIATNIHYAFIVQALDRDFNLNRLERYFVQAHSGNIQPIVVLNKADLQGKDKIENIKADIRQRLKDSEIFVTSTLNGHGLEILKKNLIAGKTYCLLGSSGVGKSSIINFLVGDKVLQVNEISDATNKGKHTTTHRELILLDNGAILIDTPGMREVGMTDSATGIELTFDQISEVGKTCKFGDCTHTDEPGCKVLEAVDEGLIAIEELENYKKLERQSEHFSATIAEKRRKEKSFGKMAKEIMKHKKKNKF